MKTPHPKLHVWSKPGAGFRSAPFWSWNGALDPEELRRQIRVFHTMGMGGFFMHSRLGLETEYLSSEWFRCVDAAVDEAEKNGMLAYLYDEDRYPSGAAGGFVTANPEYRARRIFHAEIPFAACTQATLPTHVTRLFAAVPDTDFRISGVRRIADPKEVQPQECLIVFSEGESQHSSWYNGLCYLDVFNAEAVRKFITVTHEAYRQRYAEKFGRSIPAIFTDEPHYGFVANKLDWENEQVYSTPWSEAVRERIQAQYGYDILDRLPELFYDVAEVEFSPARYHYMKTITELFMENFMKQIGDWCDAHKLKFTGHVMGEDNLASQCWNSGSVMRAYEYMSMPGMDLVRERYRGYLVAKQLSSVAHQLGKPVRLSECYGCTGWDFPLAGHRALGDWQVALGINFRCQHIAHYTLQGEAKRDFPASISYQVPWHPVYHVVEDYFARLHAILTGNNELRDILVVSPVESAWTLIRMELMQVEAMRRFDREFHEVLDVLFRATLDFDLGDEELMAKYGSVDVERGVLKIGMGEYRAVVLPPMRTMRATTRALLEQFTAAGGAVLQLGAAAGWIDGEAFAGSLPGKACTLATVARELAAWRRVRVTLPDGAPVETVLHTIQEDGDGEYLFWVNTGHVIAPVDAHDPLVEVALAERSFCSDGVEIAWKSTRSGRVYELNAATGEVRELPFRRENGCYYMQTRMEKLDSRLWMIAPNAPSLPLRSVAPVVSGMVECSDGAGFAYALTEPNVLVLDHPELKVAHEAWQPRRFVLLADDELRRAIGEEPRNNMMVQPWFHRGGATGAKLAVALRYTVICEAVPEGMLFLAMEEPERYRIRINGRELVQEADGFFVDRSAVRLRLPGSWLHPGRNEIVLEAEYTAEHRGLEALYLLGNFGVCLDGIDGVMGGLPERLQFGDWGKQGLPFYAGGVSYRIPVTRPVGTVEVEYSGCVAGVGIGDEAQTVLPWPPYRTDFGGAVSEYLTVTVTGSPRNSHGPFFGREARPDWCGPEQFKSYLAAQRQLVPCGLYALQMEEVMRQPGKEESAQVDNRMEVSLALR